MHTRLELRDGVLQGLDHLIGDWSHCWGWMIESEPDQGGEMLKQSSSKVDRGILKGGMWDGEGAWYVGRPYYVPIRPLALVSKLCQAIRRMDSVEKNLPMMFLVVKRCSTHFVHFRFMWSKDFSRETLPSRSHSRP